MARSSSKKTYSDKKGYQRFKDSNTPVHRWAAEKKLGRKLRNGEVVHHKDRNKANNAPSNLYMFRSQADHDRAHKMDARKFGNAFSYVGRRRKSGL
jgi:hypothetical protein